VTVTFQTLFFVRLAEGSSGAEDSARRR